jgi:hypothetical protein
MNWFAWWRCGLAGVIRSVAYCLAAPALLVMFVIEIMTDIADCLDAHD